LILNLVFLQESVKFSFLYKNYTQLFQTFEYISRKNGRHKEYLDWKNNNFYFNGNENIIEAREVPSNKGSHSTLYRIYCILCLKENVYTFITFCSIKICVGAAYAFNGLDMRNTSNMLVNPIIFFLTDFVVVIFSGTVIEIPSIGRKKPVLVFSSLAAIFYFIKYSIILTKPDGYSVFWIDVILRFCININFYVLTVWSIEIYPADISMLASNLNRLCSRLGRVYSPIIMLTHRRFMNSQLIALMTLSSCLIMLLTDTTGKIIKETSAAMLRGKEEQMDNCAEKENRSENEHSVSTTPDENGKLVSKKIK